VKLSANSMPVEINSHSSLALVLSSYSSAPKKLSAKKLLKKSDSAPWN
jgi:hypothetical protein